MTASTSGKDVLQFPRDPVTKVVAGPAALADYDGECLVLGVWATESSKDESSANGGAEAAKDKPYDYELPAEIKAFDKDGLIYELCKEADFYGKAGSSTEVGRSSSYGAKRVVVYGLGVQSDTTAASNALVGAAKFAVSKGTRKDPGAVGLYIDGFGATDDGRVTSLAEGVVVASYVDERYKNLSKPFEGLGKVPREVQMIGVKQVNEVGVQKGYAVGMGIVTTKEVVNAPANELTPHTLADAARTVAKECGLSVKVLGRAECEELGMGCYLGVGRASTDEVQFIHMTYTPASAGGVKKKVAFVGKAVTFDTGGTNLKVGASMIELMKFDMGGAGTVLGAAKAIGEAKPQDVEVHFIMPAVENMIGDRAIHPGDILTASNGKTVEVINTDAEGRLCLADALVYAENLGDVDYVIDLATLTGAIIVSLGNDVAGFWSPSDDFASQLNDAAKQAGEKIWRLPLVDEYTENFKSRIADMRNIATSRGAGSIIAALFLREFVKTKNWAHIDIAGTVWAEKKDGATGFGVKTLVTWLDNLLAGK